MKQRKLTVNEFEADAITVTIDGGIEKYKEAFLIIFNNVREYSFLYSVENYNNDDVTVYCDSEKYKETIDWLEQFGTIKRKDKVLMYRVDELPDCDYDKYYSQVIVPYSE